jgi:hypothetical protein
VPLVYTVTPKIVDAAVVIPDTPLYTHGTRRNAPRRNAARRRGRCVCCPATGTTRAGSYPDMTLTPAIVSEAPFPGSFWATNPGTESGSGSGPRLPVNIGHRGYKAAFPENSMAAFHGAVAAGAHAIETDLHLSRDGVVVLSHVSYWCTTTYGVSRSPVRDIRYSTQPPASPRNTHRQPR